MGGGRGRVCSGSTPSMRSVDLGALPPGLSLMSDGTVTGQPMSAGRYNLRVQAAQAGLTSATADYVIDVRAAPSDAGTPTDASLTVDANFADAEAVGADALTPHRDASLVADAAGDAGPSDDAGPSVDVGSSGEDATVDSGAAMGRDAQFDADAGESRDIDGGAGDARNRPPSAPRLHAPADAARGLTPPITFRWGASSDPDGDALTYFLHVCEDPTFSACTPLPVSHVARMRAMYAGAGWLAGLLLILGALRRRLPRWLLVFALLVAACSSGDFERDDFACGGGQRGAELHHRRMITRALRLATAPRALRGARPSSRGRCCARSPRRS